MLSVNWDFSVEDTKDNFKIIQIQNELKRIYIGSKYNMKNSIDGFINNIVNSYEKNQIFIIYGFSTGDHIKLLTEMFKNNQVIVFEPNINMKNYIEECKWVKDSINLKVFCGEFIEFKNYIIYDITIFNFRKLVISQFANYEKIYKDQYMAFTNYLNDIIRESIIDSSTRIEFGKQWVKALLKNSIHILEGDSIEEYTDMFKGKPAIIVSAGPSLEYNINQLKKIDKNMVIMSSGRTLKPLVNLDISPDMLTIIDTGKASYEIVEGYIENVELPLLFYENTNAEVLDIHKGKKIFTTQSKMIRQIIGKDLKNHVCGGSVAHTMTMAAIEFGCNPIIFIGQDCAYTNEKIHADSAEYDKTIFKNMPSKEVTDLLVEDIYGNKVRTSAVLNSFRLELEKIIECNPDVKFINATEGGARIKGTEEISLEKCIELYAGDMINFDFKSSEVKKAEVREKALNIIKDFRESVNKVIKYCETGVKLVEDLKKNFLLKNNKKINYILSKLDGIDADIKVEYEKFAEIETLLYPIIYESRMQMDSCENDRDSIIKNNLFLYCGMLNEVQSINPMIDKLIEKLE